MLKELIFPRLSYLSKKEFAYLEKKVLEYVDKYHEELRSDKIAGKPLFTYDDKDVIYDMAKVKESEVMAVVKTSPAFKGKGVTPRDPFSLTCTALISYLLTKGEEEAAKLVNLYMCFNYYSYFHGKYAMYGFDPAVMAYTHAHLSQSFDIKTVGSVLELIKTTADVLLETYKKRLMHLDDEMAIYYIIASHTRFNSKIQKIAVQYYKNKESGKYLNMDNDSFDPGDFHISTSDSKLIFALVDIIYINFINNRISKDIPELAMMGTELSARKFNEVINDIRINADDRDVRTLISNIIAYAVAYNSVPVSKIGTGKFLEACKKGYISNTKAEEMDRIKTYLETIINAASSKYGQKRYGKTAAQEYKKAVYMYFVYLIYTNAK